MTDIPAAYRHAKPQYLTVPAFCEHFGVSNMTGYRLIERGEVTAHRIGGALRIHVSEVKRFTEATRIPPKEQP